MKGLVFVLLENRIRADHGDQAWDEILEETGLEGVYTTVGDYPYQEFVALLEAAEPYIGERGREAQRWFGRRALHQLAEEFFELFEPHDSTRAFALTINDVIHPEVRKLYPGAEVPTFDIDEAPAEGDLLLRYNSGRGLCSFAEGLLEGTADLYGETITVEQPACVHEGDPHCDLVLTVEGTTEARRLADLTEDPGAEPP